MELSHIYLAVTSTKIWLLTEGKHFATCAVPVFGLTLFCHMCSSSKNLWIVCTYFATCAVPAKYALPYFPTCAVPARWVPPPLKFHNRTDVINYLTQVSKQMDFTKGFAIAGAESCEIELVVFSQSFHFPDWKMQFGAYTYPLHNQKCTVQKMKQSDLLLYEIRQIIIQV